LTSSPSISWQKIKIIPAGVSKDNFKTQLCKKSNCSYGDRCRYAHGEHELRQKVCEKWMQDACTFGKRCKYAHGTNESLLKYFLKGPERSAQRNQSGDVVTHRISTYLLQVLKPQSNIDGPAKQVFQRLWKSSSRDETGNEAPDELCKPDHLELPPQAEPALGRAVISTLAFSWGKSSAAEEAIQARAPEAFDMKGLKAVVKDDDDPFSLAETGKITAAVASRKKTVVDELHKPDQRELELQAEAAIGTGARASGRSKNPEQPTQLSRTIKHGR
jgi:hypothetical protein